MRRGPGWTAVLTLALALFLALLTAGPAQAQSIRLERIFPQVTLTQPIGLVQAPGDATHFYLWEKTGRLLRLTANGPAEVFLDWTARVSTTSEQGLLGVAFHPNYGANRYVFLNYTDLNGTTVVARFQARPDFASLDPNTWTVILTQPQPEANHNGGTLAFGPDGYLYIGLGDGGGPGSPINAQQTTSLWGSILRINVNAAGMTRPYTVPADNPFVGQPPNRDEIYAWGLRNPWKWSFDSLTGQLWAGDVGQSTWEEVDVIGLGGNYGWPCYEGYEPYPGVPAGLVCGSPPDYVFPLSVYGHVDGQCSITGGYVYRGQSMPGLVGVYLYADYCTGRVWGLIPDGQGGYANKLLTQTGLRITAFGQDNGGELYLCDIAGGAAYRILASPALSWLNLLELP